MEIEYSKQKIAFSKNMSDLDRFTFDFCKILFGLNLRFVVVSGYVAILFGRNRASEDIDVFLERIDYPRFKMLWDTISREYVCFNASDSRIAFSDYLNAGYALRFSKKDSVIPNIELKFPKTELDHWALKNGIEVDLNSERIFISPLELQIPYKLFLGSEKDLEDAKFLFGLFNGNLNHRLLNNLLKRLNCEGSFKRYLE